MRHIRPLPALRHLSLTRRRLADVVAAPGEKIETDFEKARRSMELSRQRMYAERAQRSRTIMLYSAGTVSAGVALLEVEHCSRITCLTRTTTNAKP